MLNAKLQVQEQVLTSRQVEVSRLQEELQEKTGLLDREIEKRRARTKAHVETLYQLSLKETELNSIEGQWKSRCDRLVENHVSKSTLLQVSCLISSTYLTIISCWILTACVGLLQNQIFYAK